MVLEDLNTSTAWRTHVLLKTVFRVFMVEKKERVFHPSLLITKRTPTARALPWFWRMGGVQPGNPTGRYQALRA
jgi:hypothetical protein